MKFALLTALTAALVAFAPVAHADPAPLQTGVIIYVTGPQFGEHLYDFDGDLGDIKVTMGYQRFIPASPGVYRVHENAPAGQRVGNIQCVGLASTNDAGASATITLLAGQNVLCAFHNELLPTPVVPPSPAPTPGGQVQGIVAPPMATPAPKLSASSFPTPCPASEWRSCGLVTRGASQGAAAIPAPVTQSPPAAPPATSLIKPPAAGDGGLR